MSTTVSGRIADAAQQQRANRAFELLAIAAVIAGGLVIGAYGVLQAEPPFSLAMTVFIAGAAAILVKPELGVHLTVFFAAIADYATADWYPFGLNFSSRESILFINDAITVSPFEVYLATTAVAWLVRYASARTWHIAGQPLLWPLAAFTAMLFVGFINGAILGGGDLNVAVWEFRNFLCVPVMYLLASNLFTRASQYTVLFGLVVLAVTIQNALALQFYFTIDNAERAGLEGLTEHPASLHYAWVFLLLLGLVLFPGCSAVAKLAVGVAAIPTAVLFVLSQRRAGVVALGAGFLVFALILYFRRRRAFMVLMPTVLVLTAGYTVAFWNSSSGIGFGARAIKTVFFSDDLSERDSGSTFYRVIENANLLFTLRTARLRGIGFGKPFLQPYPLPDISFFVWYQYIPHNSILYIWLKIGFVGFVAFLALIAYTLRAGIRSSFALPDGDRLAYTVAALAYVVMFVAFGYVDIVWSPRTALFLAVCMAMCSNIARLQEQEDGQEDGTGGARRRHHAVR